MAKQDQLIVRKQMVPYENSEMRKSIFQLLNTVLPFILVWFLAYKSLSISYFLTLALTVIGAGLLTRIFIIFHDCCHYSFFKSRKANDIIGTITGIITIFPYRKWQHDHAVHHASSGNLDKRGVGDISFLTVDEYLKSSLWSKISYRLYRNPFIMLILGPIYVFLLKNRFNHREARAKERLNTYITNVAIAAIVTLFCLTIGWQSFLLVQGPIFLISGAAGVWLFYVQHTYEDSYFEPNEHWNYVKAAVEGSSFYKLPKVLQWITGNIGFHHVHHLSPKVPNYHLEEAHNNIAALQNAPTITLLTSLSCLKFRLWDEQKKKFVSFKHLKTLPKTKMNQVSIQSK
ncbi:MAG TPA: fatty acid desaturase [Bacillales bacterium]|nr:fatty acid desaturase [Bacillales bacterium]